MKPNFQFIFSATYVVIFTNKIDDNSKSSKIKYYDKTKKSENVAFNVFGKSLLSQLVLHQNSCCDSKHKQNSGLDIHL